MGSVDQSIPDSIVELLWLEGVLDIGDQLNLKSKRYFRCSSMAHKYHESYLDSIWEQLWYLVPLEVDTLEQQLFAGTANQ